MMIKILSIGNSFSQDATRYLYGIARAEKVSVKVVNLYIGGCTLSRHYRNMMADAAAYDFEINGMTSTGVKISIKQALLSDDWDYVTIQQQSLKSTDIATFEPYLCELAKHVRTLCPAAKILMHQTWGYKEASGNGITTNIEIGGETGWTVELYMWDSIEGMNILAPSIMFGE
jgi:hypothetical protein